ncbi:uncharacterized protein PGTG_07765 [Puccinia graminis f. sp. tritici CRL 75-36-700-3]|uniref:Uncharacterized protein n=1 Tax=Puccinia graminis f. sp. tritici (strain CRL 75-36-700-3 / race SCCL) TaxID=418459 RepID=E3KBP0_PUCGT|nr:uncharacterized protein PGTG_07765 [Puccinia graminis f. sp. tritici CRL 75-36-700-3]EFP81516.1 hypothetical protein PGTG_07765 [Puccinia graminis f. sp. tritici CRL 75-36-700-3]
MESNKLKMNTKEKLDIKTIVLEIQNKLAQVAPTNSKKNDQLALELSEKVQEAWEFLQKQADKKDEKAEKYSLMFMLNDALVNFFSYSEKNELISENCLRTILNDNKKGHIIFNYILGRFSTNKDVANFYLNFEFQSSVQESPFTKDIHGLLKLIKQYSDVLKSLYFKYGETLQIQAVQARERDMKIEAKNSIRLTDSQQTVSGQSYFTQIQGDKKFYSVTESQAINKVTKNLIDYWKHKVKSINAHAFQSL